MASLSTIESGLRSGSLLRDRPWSGGAVASLAQFLENLKAQARMRAMGLLDHMPGQGQPGEGPTHGRQALISGPAMGALRDPAEYMGGGLGTIAGKGAKLRKALPPSKGGPLPPAPQDAALALAQKRAALPVSEGGLGLPADNTAMDRARAMFPVRALHGTDADIKAFDPGQAKATYVSLPHLRPSAKTQAQHIADGPFGGALYDLQVNPGTQSTHLVQWPDMPKAMEDAPWFDTYRVYEPSVSNESLAIPEPSRIRSRFAAFDPFRRNESDLLASLAPYLAPAAAAYWLSPYMLQREPDL